MASITCGNCHHTHTTVALVRACHRDDTFPCHWLILSDSKDGPTANDCGALAWATPHGWQCEHGHEHTTAETRHTQGWDYAHDHTEARTLAAAGIASTMMDGSAF